MFVITNVVRKCGKVADYISCAPTLFIFICRLGVHSQCCLCGPPQPGLVPASLLVHNTMEKERKVTCGLLCNIVCN